MRTPSNQDAARKPHTVPDGRGAGSGDRARDPHGDTRPVIEGESAPRLPHERDESSDSGTGAPSDVVRRGHDDVESGKSPTDKSEATDQVYRRSLRDRTPGAERD